LAERFAIIVVDIVKLRDYCLSDTHPRGRHKARVFRSRLGLTSANSEMLRRALLEAAQNRADELQSGEADEHGQRYILDFPMTTSTGSATIRSAWIVLEGEDVLRLVTCYLL